MGLFGEMENERMIGYIGRGSEPEVFPVERVVRIKAYPCGDKFLFRCKDIANLLGLKQPFQFTADLKSFLGSDHVLSGKDTLDFRDIDDHDRTPFVTADDLYRFLTSSVMRQKCSEGMKDKVTEGLLRYMGYSAGKNPFPSAGNIIDQEQ